MKLIKRKEKKGWVKGKESEGKRNERNQNKRKNRRYLRKGERKKDKR